MELGLGTIIYALSGIPILESFDHIADFGFRYIDVLAFGDFNPSFFSEVEQSKLAKRLEERGIKASSVITCAHGNIASNDGAERDFGLEQLQSAGRLIRRLGGKQVLVGKGVGNIDFDLSRERAFDNATKVIKEYCSWAREEGIIVTFELEPEYLHVCNSVESMKNLMDAVGYDNVYANIDIGHMNILREGPERMELIADRLIHMHISDNDGLAHTNSVIGQGTAKINDYITKAIELGIDRNAASVGDVAVAGIEVGAPGEYIEDAAMRVTKSLGNVLSNVRHFRNRF